MAMKKVPRTGLIIFSIFLTLIGIVCVIIAIVWQQILIYQKYGFLFGSDGFSIFIPHWSAWFYLGIIPFLIGWSMIYLFKRS